MLKRCDSGSEPEPYSTYDSLPLNDDGLVVRILQILPGAFSDDVRCTLQVKQISAITPFEALSYTWGEMERTQTIVVNGRSFKVTSNLECALRYLRARKKRRRLWVDAICINQDDLQERADQVMQMGHIYRNAEQVLIWLGSGNEKTDMAFRYMRWCLKPNGGTFEGAVEQCCPLHWYVKSDYAREKHLPGFVCQRCGRFCLCDDCPMVQNKIHDGLRDILCRVWWKRMWVVQELAMAAGDPKVRCGSSWIAWSDLVRYEATGLEWPAEREPIGCLQQIRLDVQKPARLRNLAEPVPYSSDAAAAGDLSHLLRRTAHFEATDGRDKVYALLGITRSKHWREFRPDYNISVHVLMRELAVKIILADHNLDILTLCTPTLPVRAVGGSISPLDVAGAPSWLPNFGAVGLSYLGTMNFLPDSSPLRGLTKRTSHMDVEHARIEVKDRCGKSQQQGSASVLTVTGLQVDIVGASPQRYNKLSKEAYKGMCEKPPSLSRLAKTLYYWYPVWRALDPAFLRAAGSTDCAPFHQGLQQLLESWKIAEGPNRTRAATGTAVRKIWPDSPWPNWQLLQDQYRWNISDRSRKSHQELPIEELINLFDQDEVRVGSKIKSIVDASKGRDFFVTAHGLLGIGPRDLRPGDVVVLLKDSSAAFALRKLDSGSDSGYTLVGNVYVDMPPADIPWSDPSPPLPSWTPDDVVVKEFEIW